MLSRDHASHMNQVGHSSGSMTNAEEKPPSLPERLTRTAAHKLVSAFQRRRSLAGADGHDHNRVEGQEMVSFSRRLATRMSSNHFLILRRCDSQEEIGTAMEPS